MPRILLVVAILALLFPLPTLAQEGGPFSGSDVRVPDDARRFDRIELTDTTVAELLDYFRAQDPTFQAVLLTPDVGDVPLPPLNLRNLRAADVLRLLDDEPLDFGRAVMYVDAAMLGEQLVFKVRVETADRPEPGTASQVSTLALGGPIEEDDGILELLDQFADTLPGEPELELQLHAETGIIIARGSEDQLVALEELVGAIRQTRKREDIELKLVLLQEKLAKSQRVATELQAMADAAEVRGQALIEQLRLVQERNERQAEVIRELERRVGSFEPSREDAAKDGSAD